MPCAKRGRALAAAVVALVVVMAGLTILILFGPASPDGKDDHASHAGWIALVPIYTSLIPIYIAAARRRKSKKTDG